ncbi:GyrI-like domain-containing protein [Methylocystis rosea]|uniref:GyrI-like domain-containing protein n=1 Tax=Methylocystis rosea TaxID=173366 RepID=A0ABX6EDA5_9HYPH|nr:GyrI-like domain-containing protein [Methylocystis rosea]QGM92867.1 GyrI-like domain-containing protein [Methylocystis rosea]
MEEEPGLLDSLRRHWRALAIFIVLVAGAAIYSERALVPLGGVQEADKSATPQRPTPPNAAPDTTSGETSDAKPGDAKPSESKPSEALPTDANPTEAGPTDGKPGDASPPAGAADDAAPAVMSQTVTVDARPAAVTKGQGKWEDAGKTVGEALARLSEAVGKAGLAANGRPFAVFTKTDDTGFAFEAMVPLAAAPEGKPKLPEGVSIGASPAGKALKFQHRGAYDEIEATYEAIAAYLDEKGLDTKDLILEEYLTDFKGDDASVDVDIYVFLK